jgi:hypothetical protein
MGFGPTLAAEKLQERHGIPKHKGKPLVFYSGKASGSRINNINAAEADG